MSYNESSKLLPTSSGYEQYGTAQDQLQKTKSALTNNETAGNVGDDKIAETKGTKKNPKNAGKLNTFNGVFVPTSLNILSILMFLRFGFIVGQMGVLGTMGLLLLSYLINSFTVMSISAIATNGTVKGGGAYYMISRSLGPEFGGSIGIIFFVGQILNSALNVVGFIEPLLVNFGQIDGDLFQLLPVGYFYQLLYSTILLAFCTAIALVGSKLVSKTALWLFIILLISTLSIPLSTFFSKSLYAHNAVYSTGISWYTWRDNFLPRFTKGAAGSVQDSPETFRDLFGIFFPATSGIFAGASMSGELKNPSKSIPQGTIKGLLLSFVLYAVVIISIGISVPRPLLYTDIKIIQSVNLQGYIIVLGELCTALFSVIMGIVGAASLLIAIANDKIIPGISFLCTIKKTPAQKLRVRSFSILITWFIAQIFLFADINQIAVFVTMAYLMTFIVTNLACFVLKIGSAPNFRPSFKYFNVHTALWGFSSAIVAMFIVDGMSASLVILSLSVLILLIHYTIPPSKFGDISQLLIYHQVRKYLLRLKVNMNVKYWRPQILLLCDNPRTSWSLIGFCNHLKKGGLYILGHVVILNDDTMTKSDTEMELEFGINAFKEVQKQKKAWVKLRDISKIKAFVQIALGPTLPWGVRNVYLGSGLGGMRPNITVLGFYDFVKHGITLPLSSFKNKSQFSQLPTDTCREEKQVSINQWVQVVEDLIIMQSSVAVAANFNSLNLPKLESSSSLSWSRIFGRNEDKKPPRGEKKYIDLYPIQMSSINVVDGKSVLSTNFDTYSLILQLGSILSSVPEWKLTNHRLRVIVFVEDKDEIEDEKTRVSDLLANLRIDAKIKTICLNDNSLHSYNYIVNGYVKNTTNKFEYDKIDKILRNDQWWKNLCNARETLSQLEKQKLKKKLDKDKQAANDFKTLGLKKPNNSNPEAELLDGNVNANTSPRARRNRRDTISNLHDQGVSLSFNMKGGLLNYENMESSSSSDEDEEFYEDSKLEDDQSFIDTSGSASTSEQQEVTNSAAPAVSNVTPHTLPQKYSRKNLPVNLNLKNLNLNSGTNGNLGRLSRHVSTDQLSVKSSRSNLRPNFVSIKTPQAQIHDNEDEDEEITDTAAGKQNGNTSDSKKGSGSKVATEDADLNDNDNDIDQKPSIGFVDDDIPSLTTPNETPRDRDKEDYFSLERSKKLSTSRLKHEKSGLNSPSIISNDEGIIHQLRTPQFLAVDDDVEIPSLNSSTTNLPALSGAPSGSGTGSSRQRKNQVHPPSASSHGESQSLPNSRAHSTPHSSAQSIDEQQQPVITQKQLQQELKDLSFDDIPAKGQHIILNELMRLHSPKSQTDVIFSTLPAPSLNTHLDDDESFDYVNNLSIWLGDLQPVILFNSQTVTVTTAL